MFNTCNLNGIFNVKSFRKKIGRQLLFLNLDDIELN